MDGRVTGRRREQRSSKQVADGDTCTTRRKDQGNGTFKEIRECQPKYRSEPVYAEKCDYESSRWATARTLKAAGARAEPPPWPNVDIRNPGTCLGCEREGPRTEVYKVAFREPATGKE